MASSPQPPLRCSSGLHLIRDSPLLSRIVNIESMIYSLHGFANNKDVAYTPIISALLSHSECNIQRKRNSQTQFSAKRKAVETRLTK